ncbi:MAG: DsbA family oxidoreductase [Rhodanobacter sp.]|nr:MAG: DsbA family oxidoreductase [Rhodanobacter sp.]TAM40950.1 MAG: DsbA family oxidoreductase [Rhodanobacter sp.]
MSSNTPEYLHIDIWSDYVCPWCWIAERRLETALERFQHRDLVEIGYRSYRLAPDSGPEPFVAALVRKFGDSKPAMSMMQGVQAHAATLGLTYHLDTMLLGDTIKAHTLVKSITDEALRKRLVERLYEATTSEGRSIFERQSLAEIAAEVGVPPAVADRAWSDDALTQLVIVDEKQAHAVGAGVPLFVFNDDFYISGAQPIEAYTQALEKMYSSSIDGFSSIQGQTCSMTGCDS